MSTRHWGFLGFEATRVTDTASRIVTYTQYRMDFPHFADIAAVRQYRGNYTTDRTDPLSRQETAYNTETLTYPGGSAGSHQTVLPYVSAVTEFHYEGETALGVTRTTNKLSLTDQLPMQLKRTVEVAHDASPSAGGTAWGVAPDYTLSNMQRATANTTTFNNRDDGGRWLIGFPKDVTRIDYAGAAVVANEERRVPMGFDPPSRRFDGR